MKGFGRGVAEGLCALPLMDDDAGTPAGGAGEGAGTRPGSVPVPSQMADAGAPAAAPVALGPGDPAEALIQMRALIAGAIPDLVPELLVGDSLEALVASVEPAKQAYQRIVDQVRAGSGGGTGSPSVTRLTPALPRPVPAGQPGRQGMGLDLNGLSPSAKIAEGLRRRNG